jgi:glycosyltransferase 2 family protein
MRKALTLSIKAAVSGLLLYFTLAAVNLGTVMSRLNHIDPRWVVIGLFILVVQLAALAWRWQLLVVRCGADLSFARSFRLSLIGVFFSQTLPSSVGGDATRIWLLGKQSTWRIAAYSVLLDRVIGVVALAVLVVCCLPWTLGLVRSPVGRAALLIIGFGCIAAGIVFVALSWQRLHFLQRWPPTRHLAAAANVALSILRSPSSLVAVFGLSIVIHMLAAVAAWCAARAVGADLPLLYSLYLVPPVILLTVIPISIAGWGVREGAMVVAFGYAGLAQSDGLIVSLLFGFGYLVLGIVGGLVWVLTSSGNNAVAPAVD